jgi:hypothetical protein
MGFGAGLAEDMLEEASCSRAAYQSRFLGTAGWTHTTDLLNQVKSLRRQLATSQIGNAGVHGAWSK